MKTIKIDCNSCGAKADEKCRSLGYADEAIGPSGFHRSRVRRAHYITLGEKRSRSAAGKATR